MKKYIYVFFISVVLFACSSLGTVSKGYNFSKQQIWEAITAIINKDYGGVSKILQNPPTAISKLNVVDKDFGIDKSVYQVRVSLSGFTRPYVVDVEVLVFAEGDETGPYKKDKLRAEQILNQISDFLNDKKYNTSLQELYVPY